MSDGRKIRLVLNPRSGNKDRSPESLCEEFRKHGCECIVTALHRQLDLAALHASDAADVVWVAAGGDGTVNCVAHALLGTGRVMGVLPTGTLNHFAQDLGVPTQLEEAIELAAKGEPRSVDAAEVNGHTFVNNSSLGFYPEMVIDRDRMCKRGGNKWWSMVVASVRAFVRFRRLRVELKVNGEIEKCTTALLFIGNNVYDIKGKGVGTRKRLDSRTLSMFFVPKASRIGMVRLVGSALAGRAREAGDVKMFHVEHVIVNSSKRRLKVALDGEVRRFRTPLVYKSLPKALHVIGPNKIIGRDGTGGRDGEAQP